MNNFQKKSLIVLLAMPIVASAQNLILVCDGIQEAKYSRDAKIEKKPDQYTYVFKNWKLTESSSVSASENVTWKENYILVENGTFEKGRQFITIDRISGKVLDSYIATDSGVTIEFNGVCKSAMKKF